MLWLRTNWHTRVDPNPLIVPYLATIIVFIVHIFEVAVTDITGFHVAEQTLLTIAAFVAPIIWLVGAIGHRNGAL